MTKVASPEDERALAIMARDNEADVVRVLCREYRWGEGHDGKSDQEARDLMRFERRSLTWSRRADGSIAFRVVLPPDMAANFMRCLEHREEMLFSGKDDEGGADVVSGADAGSGHEPVSDSGADSGAEPRTEPGRRESLNRSPHLPLVRPPPSAVPTRS